VVGGGVALRGRSGALFDSSQYEALFACLIMSTNAHGLTRRALAEAMDKVTSSAIQSLEGMRIAERRRFMSGE
jgi:hypothetical protein